MKSEVLQFFEEITKIPRGSGKEKGISDFLKGFAQKYGHKVVQDKENNLFIIKEATKGYEEYSPLILQGHMDMVWEKNKDVDFDFETQPIKTYIDEEGFIRAKGTTLGADNGSALAIIMSILSRNDIEHPKLEIILTIDEEVGMNGASNFDMTQLTGKHMINIDTEEDDKIYVSSAGGSRMVSVFSFEKDIVDFSEKLFKLEITGLYGGHSGIDINKNRANANKIVVEFLKKISMKHEIKIVNISGGDKNNAIPREAEVVFATAHAEYEQLKEDIDMMTKILNYGIDQELEKIVVKFTELKNNVLEKLGKLTSYDTNNLIRFLTYYPNGVKSMSKDIEGLVQTSLNMGVVRTEVKENTIVVSVNSLLRSSNNEELANLEKELTNLTLKFGGKANLDSSYGAWEFNENSQIRKIIEKAFYDVTNEKVGLSAIHAGLECGLFVEKKPELDVISIGPNIYGAHTPTEKMQISSLEKIYNILLSGLKNYDIK